MNRQQGATAMVGGVLAIIGGISLLNSRSQRQGKVRLTLLVLGLSLLPLSLFLSKKASS